MQSMDLTHHFLIAMPNMADPNFSRSLTYICEHNEQGALGVVVNRPIDMTLASLFEQIEIPLHNQALARLPVYFGGPVQGDRGFVLHRPAGSWQSTLSVNQDVGLTTSRDILQAVGEGHGPNRILVSLGYAGWAPGQLENEIQHNGWLHCDADPDLIFGRDIEEKYLRALRKIGIDPGMLSNEAGHA